MKVGDLVRLNLYVRGIPAPMGLIVSIEQRPGRLWGHAKVQWLDGNYDPYRGLDELEVVSD